MDVYKNLVAAIMLQAVRDYVDGTEKKRKQILKDLRSPYMRTLSDDQSIIIANQLELHPDDIAKRLRKINNHQQ